MGSELLTLFSEQCYPETVVVHEDFAWLLARLTAADSSIQVSLTPAAQCRAGFEPCDERRLAEQKSPVLTAQTTQPA